MGLDSVELVMECEDRFKVRLAEPDCERIRTVADLAALIVSRRSHFSGPCPTARAFFDLRKLLTEHAEIERGRVRPKARLDELFAPNERRRWRRLQKQDRRLPGLVTTGAIDRVFLWVTACLLFAWVIWSAVLWSRLGGAFAIPLSFGALVLGVTALVSIGARFRTRFPPGFETIGDVARAMTPPQVSVESPGERLIAQQRVLEEVRAVTARQLGIPVEKVLATSDFARDLGFD